MPPSRPPVDRDPALDRRRSPMALLAGVAIVVVVALLALGDGDGVDEDGTTEVEEPTTTTTAPPAADVVALRGGPWLAQPTGLVVWVVAAGGRVWVVDVDAATVAERHIEELGGGTVMPPLGAVVDDHLVVTWFGRVHAIPRQGGPARDLGPVAADVPRPAVFPSSEAGAVWVVSEPEPDADPNGPVVVEERTLDGAVRTRTAGAFPRTGPPFADGGDPGLVLHLPGEEGATYGVVDPATDERTPVLTLARPALVLAAGGSTLAATSTDECIPSCEVVVADLSTGAERRVPPPPGAGVRLAAGSVAPGGRWMVHVASSTDVSDPRPRYVVTDLATARSRITEVAVGPGVAFAPDGRSFAASPTPRAGRSVDSRLIVYEIASGEAMELPVRIQIPEGSPWYLAGAGP